jgi:hypothetical protein
MGAGLFFVLAIPLISALALLILRGMMDRNGIEETTPVTAEELQREKPEFFVADLSLEYADPFLENIEDLLDHGFSEEQRLKLMERINRLHPLTVTEAIYPVQFLGASADLLIHFLRLDNAMVRCRMESSPVIIGKIKALLAQFPGRLHAPQPEL